MVIERWPSDADAHASRVVDVIDWEEVYREQGPPLLRYLARFARPDDAQDMLQDTFARAMSAANVPPKLELRPWLYRIATNLAISRGRRQRLIRWMRLDSKFPGPSSVSDEDSLVREALQAIPLQQAVALVLRVHEGRSRAEIARILGTSEHALKARLVRGRRNFVAAYSRLERGDA